MNKLLATTALLVGTATAFAPATTNSRTSVAVQESKADLEVLAKGLNPSVGFFDPLGLADESFWEQSNEATIGFIREAEIKHGRIAMFAFVGYIVHANGIKFPWPMQMDGTPFPTVTNAPEAWDSISDNAKWQIFTFIGFLEFYREVTGTHYMRGGKPGEFPEFDAKVIPGGALNLYDPFGWSKNRSAEAKANGLEKEINNGRLAMIGILGFLSEGKVEGSVPLLKGIIPAYAGEPMAPFSHSIFPDLGIF
ncbi:chlorophyll a/b-binding protein [Fragilariopsis cylindrus CCMP1102]|uniref:Chlorophyll a/b-binding protein n=1 Tax=Fragilariopsis cylindrus CCMP1102 TaxID=635003 RepID=A0A1E7FC96_9STRA|nr:chlorophyll a/b-binding protein [Fragilariopsis cylindrus CCMP1102]|eukprot:OEU15780.1 chlorophyll a/b-binding protein [Fragilariopsis cylindrus CCMP1102]